MNNNIILTKDIPFLFKKFVIPSVIAMLITGIQSMVDGIFVGNILGPNAMASINIALPFVQLIIALSMIVSIGSQSYMGLNIGAGDINKAKDSFKTSIIIISSIGFLITVVGVIFNRQIALLLGASNIIIDYVSTYIKYVAILAIPAALSFLFGFSTRILEKPEMYFKGTILSLGVNITLNYVLIYKLNLGVMGAAIATGIAYTSVMLVVIWDFLKKESVINIFDGKFNKSVIKPILYNGSSEGVNSLSTALNAFLFNMAFMKISGEIGVAAFTAISYIAQFGTIMMFGISDGIGPIVSYNYGNKSFNRVKEVLKLSSRVILSIGIFVFILLFFFGEKLVNIFVSGEKEVINLAVNGAKIYALAFFMNGFNIVYSGFFTAIGKAKESVIVAAGRGLLFVPIGIMFLPSIFSVDGIWMSIPFAEFITFIIGSILIKKTSDGMIEN